MTRALRTRRPMRGKETGDAYVSGMYVLPIPKLLYRHECDPADPERTVTIKRSRNDGKKIHKRTYHLPLVEIRFPAPRLRDGKAPGPISGLTKAQVQWILDQKFAVPFQSIPTIEYLYNLARSLAGNALFSRFDTLIRDGLGALSQEAVWRAFWLLSDYFHDPKKPARDTFDDGWLWSHLATYLFWAECTSTGSALPWGFAKLDKYSENENIPADHRKIVEGIEKRHWGKMFGRRKRKKKPGTKK